MDSHSILQTRKRTPIHTGRTSNLSGALPKCNAKFPNSMALRTKAHRRRSFNPLSQNILDWFACQPKKSQFENGALRRKMSTTANNM